MLIALALLAASLSAQAAPSDAALLPAIAPVAADEYRSRRRELLETVKKPAILLLASGIHEGDDEVDRPFPENNFFYLTGIDVAESVLLIAGNPGQDATFQDILFLPPKDASFELWNGPRLSPGAAAEKQTGVTRTVAYTRRDGNELQSELKKLTSRGYEIFTMQPVDALLHDLLGEKGDRKETRDLRPFVNRLRVKKSAAEIVRLERAADITGLGLLEAFRALRPGAMEYQLEGALIGAFRRHGSERPGFPCICGSGKNSTVLHYMKNSRAMQAGELVVMDVGAKFDGYSADVTRTVPVAGKFSDRQREIYDIVLAAQLAAEKAVKPGANLGDVHRAAAQVIAAHGHANHFPHGTSHTIGLDVHDVMVARLTIEPGVAFTIEPGIYLPEEGFGIRIEDDYVYTASGLVRLSERVPREPAAIEALLETLQEKSAMAGK